VGNSPVFKSLILLICLLFPGIFEIDESHLSISICPRHRNAFGIRWRCQKRFCALPPSWAPHRAKQMKGDRSITFVQSRLIYKMTSTLVPIGSPICRLCRVLLSTPGPTAPAKTKEANKPPAEAAEKQMREKNAVVTSNGVHCLH